MLYIFYWIQIQLLESDREGGEKRAVSTGRPCVYMYVSMNVCMCKKYVLASILLWALAGGSQLANLQLPPSRT
jgi:hypothetical protein